MQKRRTRQHIIADLSVNYFERFVLKGGHTAQRFHFDYGYDHFIQTFNPDGELEPGYFLVQLKASDSPRYVAGRQELALTVLRSEVESWAVETAPVFLIYYDASDEKAYWLQIRREVLLQSNANASESITLRLPIQNLVNDDAIKEMHRIKSEWSSCTL